MKFNPLRPLAFPAALLLIFILIAIMLPTFAYVDDAVLSLVRTLPPEWEPMVALIARIGDVTSLIVVAFAIVVYEVSRRHYVRAAVMAGSLLALPAFYLVKETVRRSRPAAEFALQHGLHGYSFPSGHSTGTMAVYGMIAVLAYSHTKGLVRAAVVGLCGLIIVSVSFTRVYLGVHFPTDVFAGWLLGILIISLLRSASLYLAKIRRLPESRAIEDTTEDTDMLEDEEH